MLTPVAWLERVPTYKEMVEQLGLQSPSYGLLGYPLLQSADILMYRPRYVPVGVDQVPHVELTREVARRFNHLFGPVFLEPEVKLTASPKVPGTDGRKMSKSYDNAVYLTDPPEVTVPKIRTMVTDPARKRRTDPGNPDLCPVFDLHRIFTPAGEREEAARGCRTAGIGCLDCKGVLLRHLMPPLEEIRARRNEVAAAGPRKIREILEDGSRRARGIARETLGAAKSAVGIA
jgi:tryptophanyl-tRNA synthetase